MNRFSVDRAGIYMTTLDGQRVDVLRENIINSLIKEPMVELGVELQKILQENARENIVEDNSPIGVNLSGLKEAINMSDYRGKKVAHFCKILEVANKVASIKDDVKFINRAEKFNSDIQNIIKEWRGDIDEGKISDAQEWAAYGMDKSGKKRLIAKAQSKRGVQNKLERFKKENIGTRFVRYSIVQIH